MLARSIELCNFVVGLHKSQQLARCMKASVAAVYHGSSICIQFNQRDFVEVKESFLCLHKTSVTSMGRMTLKMFAARRPCAHSVRRIRATSSKRCQWPCLQMRSYVEHQRTKTNDLSELYERDKGAVGSTCQGSARAVLQCSHHDIQKSNRCL